MKTLRMALLMMALAAGFTTVAAAQGYWDNDVTAGELRNFDGFLDSHPAIANEVQRDPGLLRNPAYVARHPELREFLATHPGVREEARENPGRFVRAERRWDRREDRREEWRDRERRDRDGWRDRDGDHWRERRDRD
jgi:hypothetical protein